MSYLLLRLKSWLEKDVISAGPNQSLSEPPHQPSSNEDSSTAKGQKLTKQCFLPPRHWFFTQSWQYQN